MFIILRRGGLESGFSEPLVEIEKNSKPEKLHCVSLAIFVPLTGWNLVGSSFLANKNWLSALTLAEVDP